MLVVGVVVEIDLWDQNRDGEGGPVARGVGTQDDLQRSIGCDQVRRHHLGPFERQVQEVVPNMATVAPSFRST